MKVIEVEGKSIESAKKKALEDYSLNQDQVKIEIIDEGKSGIFGLGTSRPAKIRIFYNDLEANIAEQVREFLDGLLQKMNFDGAVFQIKEGKSKIYVELKSTDSAIIIGHRGKTLEAIQLLANMHLTHLNGNSFNKRIILDTESYRRKREIALNRLAQMLAKNVIKSGKPKLLEPMNPFERRLIHLTLQDHDKVTTISEGNGVYKRIRIQLKDKSRQT